MSVNAQPKDPIRLALSQLNARVGDLQYNASQIASAIYQAGSSGAHVLAFPELALTGYPPEDLLLRPKFIAETQTALLHIAEETRRFPSMLVIVGFIERRAVLFNSAAILHNGELIATYQKQYLPNYGVFDENRYFQQGNSTFLIQFHSALIGVSICEDIWYSAGPATIQGYAGADLLINISASPYHTQKWVERERMLATRAGDTGALLAYVNMIGGQDELVFDGGSCIFSETGAVIARSPVFTEDLLIADLPLEGAFRQRLRDPRLRQAHMEQTPHIIHVPVAYTPIDASAKLVSHIAPHIDADEEIYEALKLGVRDYVQKNGFHDVVIGVSGGIDSALTAVIAADALGAEHTHGVLLPSQYSSEGSLTDAAQLAKNLGIQTYTLPIQPIVDVVAATLKEPLGELVFGLTYENIQARSRGITLMALSNALNWLVLTTGNKSEMSVGYATLYGDMAGGFAVLKDVWKTQVYRLALFRNARAGFDLIPRASIEKAPSAELRPDQRDTDSLPPYEILDPILQAYIEDDIGLEEIINLGFDEHYARRAVQLTDKNEYKRRQAPPGVKVTRRAFGRDRRFPLTNGYHEWTVKKTYDQ